MPSDNNLIIRSLTQTLQQSFKGDADKIGELINSKLYDLINRMNGDLNQVFNAVFDGPLPAVDGFNLTRLNAASLEGTRLPDTFRVAYLDDLNGFTRGQLIVEEDDVEPFLQTGFGSILVDSVTPPGSYFRHGALTDGEFFLSQNMFWDGAAWDRDDSGLDALRIDFIDGELSFDWWDAVLNDFRNTWLFAGREQLCANFADDDYLSLFAIDDNDVIHLGETAATDTTPAGHIAIPAKISTEIPLDGDAANDGIIVMDKTLKYLVFYMAGRRYRVAGVLYP